MDISQVKIIVLSVRRMASDKIRQRKKRQELLEEPPFKFQEPDTDDLRDVKKTDRRLSDDDSADLSRTAETIFIIEFGADVTKKTLHWLIDKLRAKKSDGGAGLLIDREPILG